MAQKPRHSVARRPNLFASTSPPQRRVWLEINFSPARLSSFLTFPPSPKPLVFRAQSPSNNHQPSPIPQNLHQNAYLFVHFLAIFTFTLSFAHIPFPQLRAVTFPLGIYTPLRSTPPRPPISRLPPLLSRFALTSQTTSPTQMSRHKPRRFLPLAAFSITFR